MTPIVLCQGIARFDALTNLISQKVDNWPIVGRLFDDFHYFKGVKTHLENHGYIVYHTNVPFASSLAIRAAFLSEQIRIISQKHNTRVHAIGHSMGGLDLRYGISYNQLSRYVETVSTIGTPHLGTSFADYGLDEFGKGLIAEVRPFIDLAGFMDLTTSKWAELNNQFAGFEESNDVEYRVYATCQELNNTFFPLQLPHEIVMKHEGQNDGLVSVTSQLWTPNVGKKKIQQVNLPVKLDHLQECGWHTENKVVKDIYLKIASNGFV